WLQSSGNTGATLVAQYAAGLTTFAASSGALTTSVTLSIPITKASPYPHTWALTMQRVNGIGPECAADADCGPGNVCPSQLQLCIPSSVWTSPSAAVDNLLADPRNAAWWTAIKPLLTDPGPAPAAGTLPVGTAFTTTGSELVEALMCAAVSTDAGAGY